MNRAWWLALATIPFVLTACPRAETCLPGDDPSLTIGTGENGYTPLDEVDDELELIHGSQGGVHVLIALEATNLDASDLMLGDLRGTIGGVELGNTSPWIQMRCNPRTDTLQSWNHFLIWDAEPQDVHEQTATIDAEVTDSQGTTVTATAEAWVYDPELR